MNRDALLAARNILRGSGPTNARTVAAGRGGARTQARARGRARGFTYA